MNGSSELKAAALALLTLDRDVDFPTWCADSDAFGEACTPGAVLALFADLEHSRAACQEHGAALQRVGSALGMAAGSSLHNDLVPAIKAMQAEVEASQRRQQSSVGYTDAFYKVASLLGIGARPVSPMEVFHDEMVPMLEAAIKDATRYRFLRRYTTQSGVIHAALTELDRQTDRGIKAGSFRFSNEGHGHVYERPDGARMRCGGPGLCAVCDVDAAQKAREDQ